MTANQKLEIKPKRNIVDLENFKDKEASYAYNRYTLRQGLN